MTRFVSEKTRQKLRDVNLGRKFTAEHKMKIGLARLGKPNLKARGLKRTLETRRKMSESYRKGRIKCHSTFIPELEHYVRSLSLEKAFFLFLKRNNVKYKYEIPVKVLIDNEIRNYYVDCLVRGTNVYVECKGYCDDYGRKKMEAFKKQYKDKILVCITYDKHKNKILKSCYDEIFGINELEKFLDWLRRP